MSTTFELARQLGCVQTITVEKKPKKIEKQPFDFLLVLDFEATCWEKTAYNKGQSEIIEFPCILYDVKHNKVLDEFHQYVKPTERPRLTTFCTELTGIEQHQVDSGVPLHRCLYIFQKWISKQTETYNISFGSPDGKSGGNCIFATWSDWDLGMCLKKECDRKRLPRGLIYNKWIDVRAIYLEHYGTKPNGLEGALNELGLNFEGRQHCGLHDARNTAKLIGEMISDGVIFKMTKDLLNWK